MVLAGGLLIVALLGAAAAFAASRADDPIVGLWGRSDGRQVRVSGGGGSFSGVIVSSSSSCVPPGKQVWRISGSGSSYSGTMYWYDTSDCSAKGWGKATWTVSGDSLQHCTWDVAGASQGCVGYSRVGGGSTTTTTTDTGADTTAPTVRVFDVTTPVRPGDKVTLHWRMKDDSGKATAFISIYQGGKKVVKSIRNESASMITTDHQIDVSLPSGLVGPLYYCVSAGDVSGNKSDEECGWIKLVAPLASVSNGCGGSGWEAWVKSQNYLLDTSSYYDSGTGKSYGVNFRQACNLHDAGYGGVAVADPINGGIVDFHAWDRHRVDDKFLRDMQTLCRRAIPAAAKSALAKCLGNGGAGSIGAKSRYDVVDKVGYRFYDKDLKEPGLQPGSSR